MAGNVSKPLMAEVEAVLPRAAPGISRKEIGASVGQWAPVTIKHALRQLCEEGRAQRCGTHTHPLFHRVDPRGLDAK